MKYEVLAYCSLTDFEKRIFTVEAEGITKKEALKLTRNPAYKDFIVKVQSTDREYIKIFTLKIKDENDIQ